MNSQLVGFKHSTIPAMNNVVPNRDFGSYFDREKMYTPHNAIIDSTFQHFNDTYYRTQAPQEVLKIYHSGFTDPDKMEFILGRILPLQETTKEKFVVKSWTFDFKNMDIVPPGAIPDQQTAHMEEFNFTIDRYGQQFEMMDEELTTAEGYSVFLGHAAQMGINRFTTMILTGLFSLAAPEIIDRSEREGFGDFDTVSIDDSLRKKAQSFACLSVESNSSVQSINSVIQVGSSVIAKLSNMKPENLILPPGSDIILQQTKPEQTYYFEYTGLDPTPRVIMGINSPLILPSGIATFIAALPRFSARQSNEEFDVLKTQCVLGEYFLMSSTLHRNEDCMFLPDKKNIEIFDLERNDWIEISFRDCILRSKIFREISDSNDKFKRGDGYEWDREFMNYNGMDSMFHYKTMKGAQLVEYVLQMNDIDKDAGAKRTAEHLVAKFLSEYNTYNTSADRVLLDGKVLFRDYVMTEPKNEDDIDKLGDISYTSFKAASRTENGKQLEPFISLMESLISFLRTYLPSSELLSEKNIQPWIDSDDVGNVLFESFFGRFPPLLKRSEGVFGGERYQGRDVSKFNMSLLNDDPKFKEFIDNRLKENTNYPVNSALDVITKYYAGRYNEFWTAYEKDDEKSRKALLGKIYNEALKMESQNKNEKTNVVPLGKWKFTGRSATPGIVSYFNRIKDFGGEGGKTNYAVGSLIHLGEPETDENVIKNLPAFKNVKAKIGIVERHGDLAFLHKKIGTNQPKSGSRPFSFDTREENIGSKKIGVSYQDSLKKIHDEHFVGNAFTNIKAVETTGGSLLSVFLHAFLTCRDVPNTIMRLIDNEIYVPLNVLLTRPQMRVYTSSAILCANNVGNTYYIKGQAYNPVTEYGKRRYTVYLKFGCLVSVPEAVFNIPSVKMSGYIAGMTSEFFEFKKGGELLDQINRNDHFCKSLIPLIVPANWKPSSDILYLTDIKTKDKKHRNIPMRDYYDDVWGFTNTANDLSQRRKIERNVFYSLFRGTYFKWNHITESYNKETLVKGTGFFRDKQYIGARPAMDGVALFVANPNLK